MYSALPLLLPVSRSLIPVIRHTPASLRGQSCRANRFPSIGGKPVRVTLSPFHPDCSQVMAFCGVLPPRTSRGLSESREPGKVVSCSSHQLFIIYVYYNSVFGIVNKKTDFTLFFPFFTYFPFALRIFSPLFTEGRMNGQSCPFASLSGYSIILEKNQEKGATEANAFFYDSK